MKVKINGERIVDVPQEAIKHGMEEFGLSEIDSARMYLEDENYIFPEDKSRIEFTEEKAIKHNAASATRRKKTTRERKVDEGKKHYLSCIKVLLEGMKCKDVQMHNEVSIDFSDDKFSYTLKLAKHRPTKEQGLV